VRQKCGGVQLENDDVYMATTFGEFFKRVVLISRGVSSTKPFEYTPVNSYD
jgi:formyltetrahydrofolate dehydrogenase